MADESGRASMPDGSPRRRFWPAGRAETAAPVVGFACPIILHYRTSRTLESKPAVVRSCMAGKPRIARPARRFSRPSLDPAFHRWTGRAAKAPFAAARERMCRHSAPKPPAVGVPSRPRRAVLDPTIYNLWDETDHNFGIRAQFMDYARRDARTGARARSPETEIRAERPSPAARARADDRSGSSARRPDRDEREFRAPGRYRRASAAFGRKSRAPRRLGGAGRRNAARPSSERPAPARPASAATSSPKRSRGRRASGREGNPQQPQRHGRPTTGEPRPAGASALGAPKRQHRPGRAGIVESGQRAATTSSRRPR